MATLTQTHIINDCRNFLIVEDNLYDAELIQEFLEDNHQYGLKCTWVDRYSKAKEKLELEKFDLILLDLSLPDSEGTDTLTRLRECEPNIPIIVLTANRDEKLALQSIQSGAEDYLIKGRIDSECLIRSINYAIERHQMREALRQSEEKYRLIINNLQEIVFQTDLTDHWTFLNIVWAEITGFSIDETLGNLVGNYIHPHERIAYIQEFRNLLLQGGKKYESRLKLRLRTADGNYRWFELRQRLHYTPDGFLSGRAGTLSDINEQKLVSEALYQSQIRWQSYFENSIVGIYMMVANCETIPGQEKFIDVNQAWIELLGYSFEEVIAKTWVSLTHPDDVARELEQLCQIYANEKDGYVLDKRLLRKDGEIVYSRISVRCVREQGGSVCHLIVMVLDLSNQHYCEQKLKAAE